MLLRIAFVLALLPFAALAQTDMRLAQPMIEALQAQVALQQAMLRVAEQDREALRAALCGRMPLQKEPVPGCARTEK